MLKYFFIRLNCLSLKPCIGEYSRGKLLHIYSSPGNQVISLMKKIYENFVWLLITIVRGIHIKHTWNGKSALILASIGENVSAHIYSVLIFAGNPVTQII